MRKRTLLSIGLSTLCTHKIYASDYSCLSFDHIRNSRIWVVNSSAIPSNPYVVEHLSDRPIIMKFNYVEASRVYINWDEFDPVTGGAYIKTHQSCAKFPLIKDSRVYIIT